MATRAVADEAPAHRGPGGPTGGVLRRPIKCHVTATKRKTCIANKSSTVDQMGDRLTTIGMGRKFGAKFHLGPSNRLAAIHQHYRHTDSTDETGQTAVR